MRRITIWFLSTLSALVLLFSYHTSTSSKASTSIQALVSSSTAKGADTSGSGTGSDSRSQGNGSGGGSGGSSGSGSGSGSGGGSGGSSGSGASSGSSGSSGSSSTTTVTGDVAQTMWGPVQVRITVSGGQISQAQVVQVPWNTGRDMQINSYAVPILNQEVVQAQSAQIDMISGATVTSGGYIQSLQSAIDKANL